MTTIVMLAAAGAALLLWPNFLDLKKLLPDALNFLKGDEGKNCCGRSPTFLEATSSLANVKKRLSQTELLEDEQEEAVNILQLALTNGSEK